MSSIGHACVAGLEAPASGATPRLARFGFKVAVRDTGRQMRISWHFLKHGLPFLLHSNDMRIVSLDKATRLHVSGLLDAHRYDCLELEIAKAV
jgi:hypothetical protein